MTHFAFLLPEWPAIHDSARRAERAARVDPRTSCFYARRALELAVHWAFKHDSALKLPYQDNLSALIFEPTFRTVVGEAVFAKAQLINRLGNQAVHSPRDIPTGDSLTAVRELFHVAYWLARTYARGAKPAPGLSFDADVLPQRVLASRQTPEPRQTVEQLKKLEAELAASDEKLSLVLADKAALDQALREARAEIVLLKQAAAAEPDTHDYSEAQTRTDLIDRLLHEAGWALDGPRDREFEVTGMPNTPGKGYVDYVLWGDNGLPLAVVEAKRTSVSAKAGQQQAKLYADCLERQFGQRPLIFCTNGHEHWLWDDTSYPPRHVQGFYKKVELDLAVQRRVTRTSLATAEINPAIVDRAYQIRAIRRVGEDFEQKHLRKALLVMATGAGKTRTVVALVDLLMRCGWAKRVLFLADRRALVKQATNAFKAHLPEATPVNLLETRDDDGRVLLSTYATMMGLIQESLDGSGRFGVGAFDLVVIDEAHRSVFQKYGAIFRYFDSFLLGLTATPKADVDRNTYSLFDLEDGVPTEAYTLDQAVTDGYLVPPVAVSVPLKFQREGIAYDQLSAEERAEWDEIEWSDDGEVPERVEAEAVSRWLFNEDTVDKVLAHLMTRGLKVAGGDRLGKTIVFAKNQAHADFIVERFDANYPHWKGHFARAITYGVSYAESLIDDFSRPEKMPHLAVSVDMLDTGIDVPEVVNLVFFKLVRSKVKFWQMLGRGTRLCRDLFGPGDNKKFFYLFDFCQNLEYFSQNPEVSEGAVGESLGARLFKSRLDVLAELEERLGGGPGSSFVAESAAIYLEPQTEWQVVHTLRERLRSEVAAMNLDNFVVRPWRRTVEKYLRPEAWVGLSVAALLELAHDLAGLPTELAPEPEESLCFDLLLLRLELAQLRQSPDFERLRDQVRAIAGLLQDKAAIPSVAAEMELILDLQTPEWWVDVTLPLLEALRRRLRGLVLLIEKKERKTLFTHFVDELGEEALIELPGIAGAVGFERFRAKVQQFLRAHLDHLAIQKLRRNKPLTASDLAELERMVGESGAGNAEELARAKADSQGLGLFVRSLVGLDREAAKEALSGFVVGKTLTANQLEFVNLIVDHLTDHGAMEAARLYESPFTDLAPQGPESMFQPAEVEQLLRTLEVLKTTAVAA